MTVLNPVMPRGYPPQWAMTRLPDLTEPIFSTSFAHQSPEQRAWLASKAAGSHDLGNAEQQSSTPTALPATEQEDGTAPAPTPAPPVEAPPATASPGPPPLLRARVRRCMKVHRWQRMQRVWVEWMRDGTGTPGAASAA